MENILDKLRITTSNQKTITRSSFIIFELLVILLLFLINVENNLVKILVFILEAVLLWQFLCIMLSRKKIQSYDLSKYTNESSADIKNELTALLDNNQISYVDRKLIDETVNGILAGEQVEKSAVTATYTLLTTLVNGGTIVAPILLQVFSNIINN